MLLLYIFRAGCDSRPAVQSASASALNRFDSGTDSKVWMEEEMHFPSVTPGVYALGVFFTEVTNMQQRSDRIKKMVLLAMLAAISYLIVVLVRIPVVLFLSYEPKDVIITIGGLLMGPMASFLISLVVSALEMVTISQTGPIGCIMNLLSTCSFACTAALIYKKHRSLKGAVAGLLLGAAAMTGAMLLWNWLITPLYMGVSRQAVEALLMPVFLPFNLLKAGLNTALTLGLYKPLVGALRSAGIMPERTATGTAKPGMYLFAGILLVTCVLLMLVLGGKL